MNSIALSAGTSQELLARMQHAVDEVLRGERDAERVKQSRLNMDRIREEIRARHGILDIGVAAIRELRSTRGDSNSPAIC